MPTVLISTEPFMEVLPMMVRAPARVLPISVRRMPVLLMATAPVAVTPLFRVAKLLAVNVVVVVIPNDVKPAVEVNPPESVAEPVTFNVFAIVSPAHNGPTVKACVDTFCKEVLPVVTKRPVTVMLLVDTLPITV